MKKKLITISAFVLSLLILIGYVMAQRDYRQTNTQTNAQTYPQQRGNNQSRGFRPPLHPLMTALDTDKDHEISAAEIQNASKALLTLDKNKDGKLSRDELRPNFRGSQSGSRPNRGQGRNGQR